MKKQFWVSFLLFCGFLASSVGDIRASSSEAPVNFTDYETFVEQTGNEIITILLDKKSPLKQRKESFRAVLEKRFSLPSIAKFVLARYWRQANETQKARYLELFETATVENYAAQFDNYSNERLKVIAARAGSKGNVIVSSQILRPSGADPFEVSWHVAKTKSGELKVVDLVVNGVSMSISQRTEYNAMIQSAGGNLDRFLDKLDAQYTSSS